MKKLDIFDEENWLSEEHVPADAPITEESEETITVDSEFGTIRIVAHYGQYNHELLIEHNDAEILAYKLLALVAEKRRG